MRAILTIPLLTLLSAPSIAADIIFDPDPMPPLTAPIMEGPFTWSGRYIGVDIGYGTGKVNQNFATDGIPSDVFNIKQSEGAFGGVFMGFGRQARNIYFGLESDVQYSAIEGKYSSPSGATAKFSPGMLGSARLRAGYAMNNLFGQDLGHVLPYVTGGLAFGHFKAQIKDGNSEWTGKRGDTGYTVGGGVDYAINHNTIAKLEYQYMNFGDRTFSDDLNYTTLKFKTHTIRAGVAYKF